MPAFTAAATYLLATVGVTSTLAIVATATVLAAATSYILASTLFKPDLPDTTDKLGTRVQLPPATDNKLPVVYGSAYMQPVITDAKISVDRQYMWYVMSLSEVTDSGTITFDNGDGIPVCWWGDQKITFNATQKYRAASSVDDNGNTVTYAADELQIYFYNNGSNAPLYGAPTAINVLKEATVGKGIAVANRWTDTDVMHKTAFAIVRLKYNSDKGLTGAAQLTTLVRNTLTKPGDVLKDYLTNTRYGCAVPLARVDQAMLTQLNNYSDQTITFVDRDNVSKTQPRYRINGPIDTNQNCLNNLYNICESAGSWLQWNEVAAQWSVVINRSYQEAGRGLGDLFLVNSDNLTSGIAVNPLDSNSTYNRVQVQYPSSRLRDQPDFAYIALSDFGLTPNPNEAVNELRYTLPLVNDEVQAQYLGARKLFQSRDDLTIGFNLDYSGIQVDAGDIIRVTHEWFGWTEKLFRVTSIQEILNEDSILGVNIRATEYTPTVYTARTFRQFALSENTGILNPSNIPQPGVPVVSAQQLSAAQPYFTVSVPVISDSSADLMELYYYYSEAQTAPTSTAQFQLLQTLPAPQAAWEAGTDAIFTVSGVPSSSIWFRARLKNTALNVRSDWGPQSQTLNWAPTPVVAVVGQNFQSTLQPPILVLPADALGNPDYTNSGFELSATAGSTFLEYVNASNDDDPAFTAGRWRIGSSANTGSYTDIVTTSILVGAPSTVTSTGLIWNSVSNLQGSSGIIRIPIRYRDSAGTVYQAADAVQQVRRLNAGAQGTRGTIPVAYVSATNFDPQSATDATLSARFTAATQFIPIAGDGAKFFNPATGQTRMAQYTGTTWQELSITVPGDIIAAGTITGDRFSANTVISANIKSNNATMGSIFSSGYWLDGSSGNARFAGSMTIGSDLNVAGLITGGLLNPQVVTSVQLADSAVTANAIADAVISAQKLVDQTITNAKIAANTITSTQLQNASIIDTKLADAAVTARVIAAEAVAAQALAANAVIAGKIAANAVTSTAIANNAVSDIKILDQTISNAKIALKTITNAQIANATIVTTLIANNAITTNLIAANAIVSSLIAGNAVIAGKLAANSVAAYNISANAVTAGTIAANAVTAGTIAANAVTAGAIAANAVTAGAIAAGSIQAGKIAAGAIQANALQVGSVTTLSIAAGNIVTGHIAANAITSDLLAANSVLARSISANSVTTEAINTSAVTAGKIAAAAIQAIHISANAVTAQAIAAGSISADKLVANSITSNQLMAGNITGDRLAANTITGDKIAANTISTNNLQAGSITAEKLTANFLVGKDYSSVNAVFGDSSSPGYWFRASDGSARFGGNVSISGLVVNGEITAGSIDTPALKQNAINRIYYQRTTLDNAESIALNPTQAQYENGVWNNHWITIPHSYTFTTDSNTSGLCIIQSYVMLQVNVRPVSNATVTTTYSFNYSDQYTATGNTNIRGANVQIPVTNWGNTRPVLTSVVRRQVNGEPDWWAFIQESKVLYSPMTTQDPPFTNQLIFTLPEVVRTLDANSSYTFSHDFSFNWWGEANNLVELKLVDQYFRIQNIKV
jgi:hypothetical protein